MTDGKYVGRFEVKPIPEDLRSSFEQALTLWEDVDSFVSSIPNLSRVFLVGAGGSLMAFQAAQYVLDAKGSTPVVSMNSDEFFFRAPPSVGPNSLVFVQSGSGNTPETIQAATWAAKQGAAVAALTSNPEGPLAQAVEKTFVSAGGQVLLQLVALAILKRDGVEIAELLDALKALPAAIVPAVTAFEPRAAEIAEIMKDVPVTYLMAAGPLVGAGDTFTSCYLQEMQWKHATTINCDEFFQGPFEVFDSFTKSIVFLGEDATRPMGERVAAFLDKYAGETVYVDSKDLHLPGIADEQRGFIAPLVYSTLVARMATYFAAGRGYKLEGRRYMWQFKY